MKPNRNQQIPKSERASAMLAALCLAMVFTICLSSYMALCYTSLKTSTRNIMGAHCAELAESGIEQALYSQNNNKFSTGWTIGGGYARQTITVTLPSAAPQTKIENGQTWQTKVQVSGYGTTTPSITSWGIVTLPDGTKVTRELTAVGSVAPAFVNAIAGIGGRVRFRSSGTSTVDSYSSNPYIAPGSAVGGYSAVVLSTDNITGSISLDSGTVIKGYTVGTSVNSLSYMSTSKVIGPSTSAGVNIDSTRTLSNPNPYQPEFTEVSPSSGLLTTIALTGAQTRHLGAAGATIPSYYTFYSDITLSNTSTLYIDGPVVLTLQGSNFTIGNNAEVLIASTASGNTHVSLEVHLSTGIVNTGTGNGIYNSSGEAKRLVLMGSSNFNTQVIGSSLFCGVMYFPNATINVTAASPVLYGSLVGKAVSFTGVPTFHYDTALRTTDSTVGDSAFNCFQNTAASGAIQPVAVSAVTETVPAATPPF